MTDDKRQTTLDLPAHILAELETRVAAGLARNMSDAVADAVEHTTDDRGLGDWVTTEGAARYDRVVKGEPTLDPDQILAGVDRRRQTRRHDAGGR